MCGENRNALQCKRDMLGSPPRVRGKLQCFLKILLVHRITPACAGKTVRQILFTSLSRDHPRVCGENIEGKFREGKKEGSPPRVRGKQTLGAALYRSRGITPACAGKTLRKWRISVVDPSPQPRSPLTSRRADASSGSQRAPCAAPV